MSSFYGAAAGAYGGRLRGASFGGGASTIPSVRAVTATTTTATRPFVVGVPASAQPGDLLVAIIQVQSNAAITSHVDWAELHDFIIPASTGQGRVFCATKMCDANDAGASFGFSPSVALDNTTRAWCFAIRDASQSAAVNASAGNGRTGSVATTDMQNPTVVTTVARCRIFNFYCGETSSGSASLVIAPVGVTTTELVENAIGDTFHFGAFSEVQTAAGETIARTCTSATAFFYGGICMAVAPA